jgi:hypothetical protein
VNLVGLIACQDFDRSLIGDARKGEDAQFDGFLLVPGK